MRITIIPDPQPSKTIKDLKPGDLFQQTPSSIRVEDRTVFMALRSPGDNRVSHFMRVSDAVVFSVDVISFADIDILKDAHLTARREA